MKIITEKNNLKEKAGTALDEIIRNTDSRPLLLLLSGGSSLGLLEYVSSDSLSPNVTVGMLDDRYSTDPTVNSFGILSQTAFYVNSERNGAVFLDSAVGEFETLETYAARYESLIKEWMALYPNGIIRATVGIGPDGHTSGILPHPEDPEKFDELFNDEKLIVGYDAGDKNLYRYRITSTFTLMRKFDRVLTYMLGENKKEALQKVIAEKGSLAETPGRIIHELKNVEIYTDIDLSLK